MPTKFRPCIDIHAGEVKQIVGSTLTDGHDAAPVTNFVASQSAGAFATMYKRDTVPGGHVIMLGASEANTQAALEALREYPGGLQIGGGINDQNCKFYIENGASHVIVTSYVFREGKIDFARLDKLKELVGKEHLVLDLSCRKKPEDGKFYVMTDRWQTFTTTSIDEALFHKLAAYCDEFLVHAVDVEGKRCGIQQELVELLAQWSPIPVTYAGGARSLEDLDFVDRISNGRVDLSIGSALDIFGGDIAYTDVVAWHKQQPRHFPRERDDHPPSVRGVWRARDLECDPDVYPAQHDHLRDEQIALHPFRATTASTTHEQAPHSLVKQPGPQQPPTMNPPPPPPPSGGKSAEEMRRSTLNMEKMIKKNVLAASGRPGGMKRGLAVVEFFKQQQQQQQQQNHTGDDSEASSKRSKKDSSATANATTTFAATAVASAAAPHRPSASSLVGPPATPLIPKAALTSPSTASSSSTANAATSALLAAAHRGSPLRQAASHRASPLRQAAVRASPMRAVRASPLRQVFTSPSRRVTAPRLPEVTTSAGVPPMHSTPVLNLDDTAAATPLKPPALPAKSPFQSFQSKFAAQGARSGAGVVKTPSPARPSPQPPARRASPMPQQLDAVVPTAAASAPTMPEVVDLSEEKATPTPNQRRGQPAASNRETSVAPPSSSSLSASSASSSLVIATPPPKPLARSLFSSAASVATKSLCFSTEGVASSLDVSPDGECIVVAFTDGSVRLYEMDSTVPSDRHGYLLGHLDEESNQSSAGAHLRVKISGDGRYAFVGCRSGPRVMMSIHLHNYRNGKDTEDEDMDQLQKSFHSNSRLRGFSDAMACASRTAVDAAARRSYYLLCGLGVGTMYMWQFIEALQSSVEPEWRHMYSIPTNGNTVVIASFLPQTTTDSSVLQIAGKCEDKNVRVWNLEPATTDDGETMAHAVQGHFDVPSTKDVISFYGSHAYGIAPTGEACRFRIPSQSVAVVRTYFDMERLDMGSSSKSRRSNIILESIYASDDSKTVVAVSAEGIFYYTNQAPDEPTTEGGMLRIIGRNASLNAQYKSPMKVYKPVQADGTLLEAVMTAVTNPQNEEDGEEGYVNVDTTEAWAARWMKPSLGQDCWVCGVRNIRHWQSESQVVRKPVETTATAQAAARMTAKVPPRPSPSSKPPTSKSKPSVSSDSSPGSPVHPPKPRGLLGESARPTKQARSAEEMPSAQKKSKSKPAPVKRLDVDGAVFAGDDKPTDGRSYVQQIEQELARYKERHTKIVTEWKRRLKGERQMRRLWKDREKEFEEQLHETFLKLDAAEQKIVMLVESQKDTEKRFIFEKLKADQQSSVKVRYEQLCEQMQERMGALEHQQRVMEQTSRALLQEVDRHVQHSKQSVNGLVDRQQNECILCKDRAAVTAIVPCGHLCFCEEDADVYRRNFRGGDQVSCPVCQREMISMLRIY